METEIENNQDKQDSIELKRGATGKYTWSIKRYYNSSIDNKAELLNDIQETDRLLTEKYIQEEEPKKKSKKEEE